MAGLYGRVAARGYPSSVADGMTGAGALASQGGSYSPAHGQSVTDTAPALTTLPGFAPEAVPAPAVDLLEGTWGLPGEMLDPYQAPGYGPGTFRSHAAPAPGWAGSYGDAEAISILHENSREVHAEAFPGVAERHGQAPPDGGTVLPMHPWSDNSAGENVLEPVSGQLRFMGGMDRTQGYSLSNRYGFDAGHRERLNVTGNVINSYLDPAERPWIIPQASGSFTPTDAVQGPEPYSSMLAADNLSYNDPTSYAPPPDPATLSAPLPGAPASAGWWS